MTAILALLAVKKIADLAMMQALGVGLDVIDRCQNHVLAGSKVRRAYMHHDFAAETREAWQKLGDKIEDVLASSKSIPYYEKAS